MSAARIELNKAAKEKVILTFCEEGPRGNCNCFQILLDERKASSLQLLCIKEMRLHARMHRTQGRSVLSCSDYRNLYWQYWLSLLIAKAFCPRSQDLKQL